MGGALGGAIGLPLTLVVAEFGMLFGFLWLLLSPVRALRTPPAPGAHVEFQTAAAERAPMM